MIDPGLLLAQYGEQQVAAFFLVLARVSPLFLLAPMFSSRSIPGRVRGIAAVAIAFGLSAIVRGGDPIPMEPFAFGGLMLKEILVGLAYSFILGALFAAVAAAGSFLDTLIGFSFGVLVFIAIGGDGWVIQGLARTYELVPLLEAPELGSLVGGAQAAFTGVFASALAMCAPIVLALVITDVAFGVVSKVVPQLNVFGVGFPAKVAVGLILTGVSLPFAAGWLADELQRSVGAALESLQIA